MMVRCSCASIAKCRMDSFCFFKQKTAYEMRISDWSSDVCSSDLASENLPSRRRFCSAVRCAGRSMITALLCLCGTGDARQSTRGTIVNPLPQKDRLLTHYSRWRRRGDDEPLTDRTYPPF